MNATSHQMKAKFASKKRAGPTEGSAQMSTGCGSCVTVVIPTFNAEKTIEKCIQSVLSQTVKPAEIIAINDGSTDKTSEILKKFGKKIRIIENKKNLGKSCSRNMGAKEAKSEIIAFLDSDVWVEKNWLQKLLAPFEKNPSIFGVSGTYEIEKKNFLSNDFLNFSISASSFQGYNVAFKRKAFLELNGFDEKLRHAEDPEFVWKAFNAGKKLIQVNAKSFHEAYPLNKRIKVNAVYAYWDGIVIRKKLRSLLQNFKEFVFFAPKSAKFTVAYYLSLLFSLILIIFSFALTNSALSVFWVLLPSVLGIASIYSRRFKARHSNSIEALMVFSFAAFLIFTLTKGIAFALGFLSFWK